MLTQYEWTEVRNLFQVPQQRIYILGSFARHVTVYSQQVRALNLIAALRSGGLLANKPKIAVVGAGAAGLMAAAAAAHAGAEVTILEELDGPMELQRNNRQRWLHPHIYDWPFTDRAGPEAHLPLLTWRAAYASDVAEQIVQQWTRLTRPGCLGNAGSICSEWSVSEIIVTNEQDVPVISWTDREHHNKSVEFSLVIMAVGFGLEPEEGSSDSYWSEDRIDGDFRRSAAPRQWFVSGTGDGGLTDVMRLCIRRFRHHEIAELFSRIPGIEELKQQLRVIHPEHNDPEPKLLHNNFYDLMQMNLKNEEPRKWKALTQVLDSPDILRTGLSIKLASSTRFLYGPRSSILNRLVLSQLERLGRITFLPAETLGTPREGDRYKISLRNRPVFAADQVIIRHGPRPALERFPSVWEDSAPLRAIWKSVGLNRDKTRLRLWAPGEFGPESGVAQPVNFVDSNLSVRAERLSITKELREDGSSQVKYEIQGLSVLRGSLRGLQCTIRATTGSVAMPVLDEDAKRLNMEWEHVEQDDTTSLPDEAKDSGRQVSRILYFGAPLRPGNTPLSFGFSAALINGDALSHWEFLQMYKPDERIHVNGEPLAGSEFLARFVWFPIDLLEVRITLPAAIQDIPSLRVFRSDRKLKNSEIVADEILRMLPPAHSLLYPARKNKKWIEDPETLSSEAKYLNPLSPQTWELSIPKPPVPSCYTLNWTLPDKVPPPELTAALQESTAFRTRCLQHGRARRGGAAGDPTLRRAFLTLAKALHDLFALAEKDLELFEVSLMTYDEPAQELVTFEALVSGEDKMTDKLGDFRLPFGLGLAGTAFKECDKVHMFRKAAQDELRPSNYWPLSGSVVHEVLLAVPFEHPQTSALPQDSPLWGKFDRPRTCLGILNLGSNHADSPLKGELSIDQLLKLHELCQSFTTAFFQKAAN